MRVFYGFDGVDKIVRPVVTIGSYDGVHCGHREILRRVTMLADEEQGESVVITFHPHPRRVLAGGGDVVLINTLPEKICLLEGAGIDDLVVIPFTPEFSAISSYDFVADYLVGKLHIHALMVGYNHHFGSNKEGDFARLDELSHLFGFELYQMPRQEVGGSKVSSTVIRQLLEAGRIDEAARFLGEPFFVMARLSGGELTDIEPEKILPPPGEYRVEVRTVDAEHYLSCAIRPAPAAARILARCRIAPGRKVTLTATDGELPQGDVIMTFL